MSKPTRYALPAHVLQPLYLDTPTPSHRTPTNLLRDSNPSAWVLQPLCPVTPTPLPRDSNPFFHEPESIHSRTPTPFNQMMLVGPDGLAHALDEVTPSYSTHCTHPRPDVHPNFETAISCLTGDWGE